MLNLIDGGIANATRGVVDYAAQCFVVIGVDGESEVAHGVLDFLALVERKSAVDAISQVALAKRFFQDAALCVCAI